MRTGNGATGTHLRQRGPMATFLSLPQMGGRALQLCTAPLSSLSADARPARKLTGFGLSHLPWHPCCAHFSTLVLDALQLAS